MNKAKAEMLQKMDNTVKHQGKKGVLVNTLKLIAAEQYGYGDGIINNHIAKKTLTGEWEYDSFTEKVYPAGKGEKTSDQKTDSEIDAILSAEHKKTDE